jgi:hypothetical protein
MKSLSYITLILAMGAVVLGSFCRNYGGEIRHTEIREKCITKIQLYQARKISNSKQKSGKKNFLTKNKH